MSAPRYILTTSTPDTTGIVAAITGFLAERKLSITETQHFLDPPTSRSYLRTVFQDGGRGLPALDAIAGEFAPVAARFGMEWRFHDAHRRCRVLIGATAHYVTGDLDEGPIIEQEDERVDHNDSPEELTSIGHDIESLALNRAVRWHAEHHVFVHGNRTVVLR